MFCCKFDFTLQNTKVWSDNKSNEVTTVSRLSIAMVNFPVPPITIHLSILQGKAKPCWSIFANLAQAHKKPHRTLKGCAHGTPSFFTSLPSSVYLNNGGDKGEPVFTSMPILLLIGWGTNLSSCYIDFSMLLIIVVIAGAYLFKALMESQQRS